MIPYRVYRETLSEKDKIAYDQITQAIEQYKDGVKVCTNPQQVDKIINQCIINDCPEYFYYDSYAYIDYPKTDSCQLFLKYNCKQAEAKRQLECCRKKANEILSGIDGKSEFEKEICIHNRICDNVIYENYGGETQKMTSVFLKGKSVCAGISMAAKYCFDLAGMESTTMVGLAGDSNKRESWGLHKWNLVKVDGYWYHNDITWDNCGSDGLGFSTQSTYDFFNVTDLDIEDTHEICYDVNVRADHIDQNFFVVHDLYAYNKVYLEEILKREWRKSQKVITFRYSSLMEDGIDDLICSTINSLATKRLIKYATYSFTYGNNVAIIKR